MGNTPKQKHNIEVVNKTDIFSRVLSVTALVCSLVGVVYQNFTHPQFQFIQEYWKENGVVSWKKNKIYRYKISGEVTLKNNSIRTGYIQTLEYIPDPRVITHTTIATIAKEPIYPFQTKTLPFEIFLEINNELVVEDGGMLRFRPQDNFGQSVKTMDGSIFSIDLKAIYTPEAIPAFAKPSVPKPSHR